MEENKPGALRQQMQELLAALAEKLAHLPGDQREPAQAHLQSIQALLDDLEQTACADAPAPQPFTGAFFDNLQEAGLVYQIIRGEAGQVIDWTYLRANQAALTVLGRERGALIGRRASQLFDTEYIRRAAADIQALLASGETITREETFQGRCFSTRLFFIDENTVGRLAIDITEHKQAEEQLRKAQEEFSSSETMYRYIADSIADPLAAYDNDLHLTFRNEAAKNATMIPDQQALGKTFTELYPDLAGSEIHLTYLRALETRQPQRNLTRWVRPTDQREFYYDLTVYPARNGVVASSKDISERYRADEALRKALEHAAWMARFPDENPNPVFRITIDGVVLYHNRVAGELPGWNLQVGKHVPADLQPLIDAVIRQGNKYEEDILLGEKIYSLALMYFANDQYINIYGMDITDRKRAEDEAHQRANELETMMDAVPSMIWIARDPECKVMIGNRLGYEFLRMGAGENISVSAPDAVVANQHYQNMRDGKPIPPEEMPMQIAAATGKPARDFMFDMVFDDGSKYQLIGNVNPLFDNQGMPSGAVGAFVDITLLRRLEEEKVEARAQIEVQRRLMEYREKERQGLARDLHDGPIQTLAGTAFNIQFIKEAFNDPALRLELEQISYSIKNTIRDLRETVNDLRPPSLIRFGLTKAIQIHTEDMRERHPEISFETDLQDDENRLSEQACLTLFRIYQEGISNALRHSGADSILVVYRITGSEFRLELRDNGRGFQVTQDLTDMTSEGHFGLVGIKERAQSIGGEFTVLSEPGQGARLVITGPLLGKNLK